MVGACVPAPCDARCGRHRVELSCNTLSFFTPPRTDGADGPRPISDDGSRLAEGATPPPVDAHTYARISATPLTA